MFSECHVKSMDYMFKNCFKFNQLIKFNMTNIKSFNNILYNCFALEKEINNKNLKISIC